MLDFSRKKAKQHGASRDSLTELWPRHLSPLKWNQLHATHACLGLPPRLLISSFPQHPTQGHVWGLVSSQGHTIPLTSGHKAHPAPSHLYSYFTDPSGTWLQALNFLSLFSESLVCLWTWLTFGFVCAFSYFWINLSKVLSIWGVSSKNQIWHWWSCLCIFLMLLLSSLLIFLLLFKDWFWFLQY